MIKILNNILNLLALISILLPSIVYSFVILIISTYGIPFIIIYGLNSFIDIGLKLTTITFISLSLASILLVYASEYLLPIILNYNPFMLKNSNDEPIRVYTRQLVTLVYIRGNVMFLVYLFYLVFIFVTALYRTQYDKPFIEETDAPILQSFAIFLAFTNMMTKSKDTILKRHELLALFHKIIEESKIKK